MQFYRYKSVSILKMSFPRQFQASYFLPVATNVASFLGIFPDKYIFQQIPNILCKLWNVIWAAILLLR